MKTVIIAFVALLSCATAASAASLNGSPSSVQLMYREAKKNDFTFLESASELSKFVKMGILVPAKGSDDYEVSDVSHPYTRRTTKLFIDRFSSQYHLQCREAMVVTSETRPMDEQPPNASRYSVHPTGMSVDVRVPAKKSCEKWMRTTLLKLESLGVIEATREHNPQHFHIAVFPEKYPAYVSRRNPRLRKKPAVLSAKRSR